MAYIIPQLGQMSMKFPYTLPQPHMNTYPLSFGPGYILTTISMPILTPSKFLGHIILPPSNQMVHTGSSPCTMTSGLVFPLPTQVGNKIEVTQTTQSIPTTIQMRNSSMPLNGGEPPTIGKFLTWGEQLGWDKSTAGNLPLDLGKEIITCTSTTITYGLYNVLPYPGTTNTP